MKLQQILRRLTGRRGFSIIELAVVLAVMSIIAAVIVPDFIESAKNDLAHQAATQAYNLQGIARDFYHQQALKLPVNPAQARWPGEDPNGPYTVPDCKAGGRTAKEELLKPLDGPPMITSLEITNPWGGELFMHLERSRGARAGILAGAACKFVITTDIPSMVSGVFETFLPGGVCNGRAGMGNPCLYNATNPPAGFARCCLLTPRPGVEAALSVSLAKKSKERIRRRRGRGRF